MIKKPNVLFVSSWYPNKLEPKNGNFVQKHAQAVSKNNNVAVLHVASNIQNENFILNKHLNNNVLEIIVYYKKHLLHLPILSQLKKKKLQKKAFLKGYETIIKDFGKIDIVHLNVIFPAGIFALYLKSKYNIPFIITEHSSAFSENSPKKISIIEKMIMKKITKESNKICPVSYNLKNAMIRNGIKGEFQIIPNVVDTNVFFPEKHSSKNVKILHISNFVEVCKNVKGIINVASEFYKKNINVKFTIAGDGELATLIKYANQLKIPSDFINFKGEMSTKEVANMMRQHDIFILFSNYENLPCVISEAHVTGIPVISSNVGGIPEMVDNKNGILVKPNDENEMIDKLNIMIQNIQEYNKTEISKTAAKRYSYESVGIQYSKIYDEILNGS